MSVFKKTGVYHFRFMHRGRVIRKSTKQGDKRTAELMEAKEKTALALGDAGLREKPKAPTLAQFITNRLTAWVENQTSTTGIWFKSGMRPLAEYKPIAGCTLDAITSEKIADYAAHRQGEGLAVGSINRELRVLRRCLRLATEWGIVETAPKVKMAGAEIRRERVVGDEEFRKYLACAIPLLTHVATLLNETGLRPEECHRLEWSDIDLGARALLIRQGKTPAARRRLPLTPNARNVLESRWQDAGGPETGFVFPGPYHERTHRALDVKKAAPQGTREIRCAELPALFIASHFRNEDCSARGCLDAVSHHGLGFIERGYDLRSRSR